MDLFLLHEFLIYAKSESLSVSAEKLGITSTTLSNHLKRISQYTGYEVLLIDDTNRIIPGELTKEGQHLVRELYKFKQNLGEMAFPWDCTVSDLRCFLVLAETESFSKTADRMYYSQATLSKRIKRMEKSMHTKLFHRNSHHVAITEEGRHFQELLEQEMSTMARLFHKLNLEV